MNASVIKDLINIIDKPAIFIGVDHSIVAVNRAYQHEYPSKIALGQSKCFEISHKLDKPCDQAGEACPMNECRANQKAASVVHVHDTHLGKQYCDILMKPIYDEHKQLVGFVEILDKIHFASSTVKTNTMLGKSDAFISLVNKVNRVAKTEVSVLLQGETGTGKELVARALHEASPRVDKPLVVIECSGLPEHLFESELFGHEKGAFTGATSQKKGLVEVVDGGTLFFDEIADIPLNMQVKLLRLLETQSFRSVGGLKQKRSDFRLVCASHKNILEMVDKGEFRQDLYYRIASFPVYLPALRERQDDIPLLAEYFLQGSEFKHKHFSKQALDKLSHYDYPGNIRELKSLVLQSAILANEEKISQEDVPIYNTRGTESEATQIQPSVLESPHSLEQAEYAYLRQRIDHWSGSADALANTLGISTRTLYRKLKKHQLSLNESKVN